MAVGFIRGFGLKAGAIASSVAHDSHNVVAVGVDDRGMEAAARDVRYAALAELAAHAGAGHLLLAHHQDDQAETVLLRLARDKRLISTGQYAKAVELTQSIGKQATGWRKSAASPVA